MKEAGAGSTKVNVVRESFVARRKIVNVLLLPLSALLLSSCQPATALRQPGEGVTNSQAVSPKTPAGNIASATRRWSAGSGQTLQERETGQTVDNRAVTLRLKA